MFKDSGVDEFLVRTGAKTGPLPRPPTQMAVGSDINIAISGESQKWSQGESNPRLRRERPPS
jgi:hypothetical protein